MPALVPDTSPDASTEAMLGSEVAHATVAVVGFPFQSLTTAVSGTVAPTATPVADGITVTLKLPNVA